MGYKAEWERQYQSETRVERMIWLIILFPFAMIHLWLECARWHVDRMAAGTAEEGENDRTECRKQKGKF